MKRSERMELLLKLAKLKEQQAARQLARGVRELDQQRRQTAQLADYQREYNQQFGGQAASLPAAQLANYQAFYGGLTRAGGAQQQRVEQAEQNYQLVSRQWQHQHARQLNFERLVEREKKAEQAQADKREQRAMDDRRFKMLFT